MHFLTQKELLELNDYMMSHISLMEKYGMYSMQCQDQELKGIIQRHQNMLQHHYSNLRKFMEEASGVQTGLTATAPLTGTTYQAQTQFQQQQP